MQVVATKKLTSYLGMSPNANAVRIMQEDLEAGSAENEVDAPTNSHQKATISLSAGWHNEAKHKPLLSSSSAITSPTEGDVIPRRANDLLPNIGNAAGHTPNSNRGHQRQQGAKSQWLAMKHHSLLASVEGMDSSAHAMEVLYPTHNRYTRQQLPEKVGMRPAGEKRLHKLSSLRTAAESDQEASRICDGFLAEAINEILNDEHNNNNEHDGIYLDRREHHHSHQHNSLVLHERHTSSNSLDFSSSYYSTGHQLFEASDEEVDPEFEFIMDPVSLISLI
jgi:hypothetical protein